MSDRVSGRKASQTEPGPNQGGLPQQAQHGDPHKTKRAPGGGGGEEISRAPQKPRQGPEDKSRPPASDKEADDQADGEK